MYLFGPPRDGVEGPVVTVLLLILPSVVLPLEDDLASDVHVVVVVDVVGRGRRPPAGLDQDGGVVRREDAFANQLLRHRDGAVVGDAQVGQVVQEPGGDKHRDLKYLLLLIYYLDKTESLIFVTRDLRNGKADYGVSYTTRIVIMR